MNMTAQLIKPDEQQQQIQLLLEGMEVQVDHSELRRNYTAERVARDRPEQYKAAIKLLANGFNHDRISNALNMDKRTVRAIYYREIKEVERQREITRAALFPELMATIEQYHDQIENMKGEKAGIGLGIVIDKWMQLSGMPTAHVEIEHKFDFSQGVMQLKELLHEAGVRGREKLAKAEVVVEAEVTEG